MGIANFIYSLADGHLDCLYFLVVMTSTAKNNVDSWLPEARGGKRSTANGHGEGLLEKMEIF